MSCGLRDSNTNETNISAQLLAGQKHRQGHVYNDVTDLHVEEWRGCTEEVGTSMSPPAVKSPVDPWERGGGGMSLLCFLSPANSLSLCFQSTHLSLFSEMFSVFVSLSISVGVTL